MRPEIKPLRRFGQNFLTQPGIANKIVQSLQITKDNTVLEIGPGPGILSDFIVKRNPIRYILVEFDKRWALWLEKKYPGLEVINEDFLKLDVTSFETRELKIIGNIPYNITSPILFKLFDAHKTIYKAVLMVQKEVAKRLTAQNGNKDYGIPTVIVQTVSNIEYLFDVGKANFNPQPKVDSAVICMTFRKKIENVEDFNLLKKIVRGTFNYRRKTLKNSLGRIFPNDIVNSIAEFDLQLRPENLSVLDFQNLSNTIYNLIKQKN